MVRPIARFSAPAMLSMSVGLVGLVWACGTDVTIGKVPEDVSAPPAFADPDAEATPPSEDGLVAYCASNKCPSGRVTCPSSRFPCDVDLRTDVNNCGSCGFECPTGSGLDTFVCVEGACVLVCGPSRLDCDGLSDNGCETSLADPNHCGSCGNECTDPARPCKFQDLANTVAACGCPGNEAYCGGRCVDVENSDSNCGACGVACGAGGLDASAAPNLKYGCLGGACSLKCDSGFTNCEAPLEEGCKVKLGTDENCAECGDACAAGQRCRVNLATLRNECMCAAGLTFCQPGIPCDESDGVVCAGICVDLTTNTANCGACGVTCPGGVCLYGECVSVCFEGTADCNNSRVDGCEVNTDSDPRNCGGCGHACDAVAGQACVAGRCVVEPCSDDAGGGGAR